MPDAVDRINAAAAEPHAVDHLSTYFHEPGHIAGLAGFTGAWFERLGNPGPGDAFRLTGTDISALSTLSVDVPAEVAIRLLQDKAAQIEDLLGRIPADRQIWEVDEQVLGTDGAAEALWRLFRRTGKRKDTADRWVTAHKLCARKRPALLPVYDREVRGVVAPEEGLWWPTAWRSMQQPALRERLAVVHRDAAVPEQVTLLRTLDVVLWMEARHRKQGRCGHDRS